MNQSAEKREDQRRHQSGSQISGVEEGRLELSERGVKMEQKRWSGKILVAHRQEPGVGFHYRVGILFINVSLYCVIL
ncbi:unnamed protein product [Miscanthus lutarioriparius]|uniref:Uncharacterized protein n=1 Tax=Miscanthus lutarioriparius TaxID=422564 RepID=A0A811P4S7_9POAL|nr:unnamed protein product [Miscanthus lutarioriparius]